MSGPRGLGRHRGCLPGGLPDEDVGPLPGKGTFASVINVVLLEDPLLRLCRPGLPPWLPHHIERRIP